MLFSSGSIPHSTRVLLKPPARLVRTRTVAPRTQSTRQKLAPRQFEWHKHWWPVQLESNLKADRPNRVQLLGGWFVLWRVGEGEWLAGEDRCPHRLAPLSEGRVESDGTLACAYHGWRFDQDGSCVAIPQADGSEAQRNACTTTKSRLKKFPCKALGNVLWVWPDSSATAFIDAHAKPIPMLKDLAAVMEERAQNGLPAGFTRVLPYSYDVLVENLSDPAHLPVAHHGIPGLDRTKASSLAMKPDEVLETPYKDQVFGSWSYNAIGQPGDWAHVEISPTCTTYRAGKTRDIEKSIGQTLLHTPLAPGKSRAFVFFVTPKALKGGAKAVPVLLKWMPWIVCIGTNKIFDMDLVFLRAQDQYLCSLKPDEGTRSAKSPSLQQYFLPSTSDLTAAGFRKWYDGSGGGGPTYLKNSGDVMDFSDLPREILLDRYQCHARDCSLCQQGDLVMRRISLGAQIIGAACFLGLSSAVGSHAGWKGALPWISGLAASVMARHLAEDHRTVFKYREFYHADN